MNIGKGFTDIERSEDLLDAGIAKGSTERHQPSERLVDCPTSRMRYTEVGG
jgi:hypothetical protein